MNMTLKEIAERLAALDGRDPVELHIQLRNPLIKQLLNPMEVGRARTSAAKYALSELHRARLLMVLADIGLTSGELRGVNDELSQCNSLKTVGTVEGKIAQPKSFEGEGPKDGLLNLIRGTLRGEEWELRLRFTRTPEGTRRATTWIKWLPWEDDALSSDVVDILYEETHLGTLTIPASKLIRPLLDVAE